MRENQFWPDRLRTNGRAGSWWPNKSGAQRPLDEVGRSAQSSANGPGELKGFSRAWSFRWKPGQMTNSVLTGGRFVGWVVRQPKEFFVSVFRAAVPPFQRSHLCRFRDPTTRKSHL